MTWELTRGRFVKELEGLSAAQLVWKLYPAALSIGQMAIHVAGVEVSFASQLAGTSLDVFSTRVKQAATNGIVNEEPFPFPDSEITPETVARAMEQGRAIVEALITNPTDEIRSRQIKSALGPMIDGSGALARLSFHPGYHQGQAHLVKTAPGFPR